MSSITVKVPDSKPTLVRFDSIGLGQRFTIDGSNSEYMKIEPGRLEFISVQRNLVNLNTGVSGHLMPAAMVTPAGAQGKPTGVRWADVDGARPFWHKGRLCVDVDGSAVDMITMETPEGWDEGGPCFGHVVYPVDITIIPAFGPPAE